MNRIAILSLEDPYSSSTGGTLRTRFLARAITSLGIEAVVFFPASTKGAGSSRTQVLKRRAQRSAIGKLKRELLPMPTASGGHNKDLVSAIKRGGPFDAVLVTSLSQYRIASAVELPIWYDFMDLWSDFCLREANSRRGLKRITSLTQVASLKRQEHRVLADASAVSVAGWSDHSRIVGRRSDSVWLPTPMPDAVFAGSRENCITNTAGFIGNFHYWPNRDAYKHLCEDWLEPMAAMGWKCIVAGLASDTLPPVAGIQRLGAVSDVSEFYSKVDITVAPIRLGGGIKVKVVESLARGFPVVASNHSLEGLPPAVRNMVREFRTEDECFPVRPNDIAPLDTREDARLDPFRESSATEVVSELLSRVI